MDRAPLSPPQLLLKRPSPATKAMLILLLAVFAVGGSWLALLGLSPGATLTERILLCALAATVLFFPLRVAFVSVRRRVQQGHWTPTTEERLQNLAQVRTQSKLAGVVSSPWFDASLCALFGYNVWLVLRPGHAPLSSFDLSLAVVWIVLAVLSLWSVYRKVTRHPV